MKSVAPKTIAINKVIDRVIRRDQGRLLTGLISRLGDFQTAEDALQEAFISALGHWGHSGVPDSPTSWLMRVALNKGVDRIRKDIREGKKVHEFSQMQFLRTDNNDPRDFPDDRLRLIFTCCHPALEEKSRVALTLRTVCNLTTREIADAFLDTETTMGQRISRAKTKIRVKRIKFSVPEPDQWTERLDAVLSSIYLIFTTGYLAEEQRQRSLCIEAVFLARLLIRLRPDDSEIEGALALMLFTESRRQARLCNDTLVPVVEQDKTLWKIDLIIEARNLLSVAMTRQRLGPFQIKAAIADCHMADPVPDWRQMSFLYQLLWGYESTSIVALNWSVVLAELGYAGLALQKLETLQTELLDFQPWHAARANIFEKLNMANEAQVAYKEAIQRTSLIGSRAFLEKKLMRLEEKDRVNDSQTVAHR